MKTKRLTLVLVVLFLATLPLLARPISIKCPYDGASMFFDHVVRVGPGPKDWNCWYSHPLRDREGNFIKHEAYVPCGG